MKKSFIALFPLLISLSVFAELIPSKVDGNLSIPNGTEIEVLGEVYSPTALAMSEDGGIFVAETHRFGDGLGIDDNRRYLYWVLDDLRSKTTADRRALYEKWAHRQPLETYTKHSERIRHLMPGAQGAALKSGIWAEGFNDVLDGTMSGIGVYEGKVYAACIPHLWLLEDKDGDGKADVRKSLQDGFGIRVSISGHDMNGFALGPDGRIYWTIGDRGFNIHTKEGKHLESLGQGAVLRMEPDGSRIEIVHGGLRNPKEIAFNEFGDAITVDNNADIGDQARVVAIVEGGDSGWNMGHQVLSSFHETIGLEKKPLCRWMAEKMWRPRCDGQLASILPPIANFTSGPSGLDYYPGVGVGEPGKFLICDYRGGAANSAILSFGISPDGAGFKLVDPSTFNAGVTASDVMFGYDGNVYVADFGGGWTSHDAGRVYRVVQNSKAAHGNTMELMKAKFWTREPQELVEFLHHADLRVRTRAHIALGDAGERGVAVLVAASQSGNDLVTRRHAVWGLGISARRGQQAAATSRLAEMLADEIPELRAQAARVYGEAAGAHAENLYPLLQDVAVRVRFFAAQSLARIGDRAAVNPLLKMLTRNDGVDIYLRHAGVNALRHCASPEQMLELKSQKSDELRLCAVLVLRAMKHAGLVEFLADNNPSVQREAISAIHDQQLLSIQPSLNGLLENAMSSIETGGDAPSWSRFTWHRLVHSAFRVGGEKNAWLLVRVAASQSLSLRIRSEALRLLGQWQHPPVVDQSLGVYAPLDERPLQPLLALLQEKLGVVLSQDGRILDPALDLMAKYDLQVEGCGMDRLKAMAANRKLSESVRAKAVKAMTRAGGVKVKPLLVGYARDKQPLVSAAALEGLIPLDPDAAMQHLNEIVTSREAVLRRRQLAWGLIGKTNRPEVPAMIVKALEMLATADADRGCALEVVTLASETKQAQVAEALKKYRAWQQGQPLGKWQLAIEGGNAKQGKVRFRTHGTAQCLRCHTIDDGHGAGGAAGPNLSNIGNLRDRDYLVRSLVFPHADVAEGFGSTTLIFPNGAFLSGVLEKQTADDLFISNGEKLWRVSKKLKFSQSEPVSAMPAMDQMLELDEVRDIVAYLSEQKNKAAPTAEQEVAAIEFDPATAPQDSYLLGKEVYKNACSFCHKDMGEGDTTFPPLAGSEWLKLDPTSLARMQIHGLMGELTVKGKNYHAAMPSNARLTDAELAAVLQFIRKEWGGIDEHIPAETIANVRKEKRNTMWTIDEIKQLAPADAKARVEQAKASRLQQK